jgi:hypothetical protein
MSTEITKPILRDGIEHIKSPDELHGYSITSHGYVMGINGKTLVQRVKNGYATVGLQINGKKKMFFVHRLVACFFNPLGFSLNETYMQVNHKNGNKLDNHIDNLEWVTPSQNTKHAYDSGLNKNVIKETKKANSKQVIDTKSGLYYDSAKEAAICKHIKYGTLRNMLNGHDKNNTTLKYV